MAKVQLGVIFGSRSCEREVSIISAVQLMNHVDSEKYDVIPVYIGENGVWYTGNALRRIETYTPFDPNKAGIEAVALDVTAGSGALLANRPGKGLFSHPTQVVVARLEVCVIVMHGLNGTARCKGCWNWRICRTRPRAWQAAPSAWTKS